MKSRSTRTLRIALFGAAFAGSLALCLVTVGRALDAAGTQPLTTRHEVGMWMRSEAKMWSRMGTPAETIRVTFLGDSMVVSYPASRSVPERLQAELARGAPGGPRFRVFSLALAGTGAFDHYFLAQEISATRPDLVIVCFNLVSASPSFRDAFARPELAGWMEPSRIPEAALLPLGWIGLSFDRLLLYNAIVRLGLFDAWVRLSEEQTRVEETRKALELAVAYRDARGRIPEKSFSGAMLFFTAARNKIEGEERYTAAGMRSNLGAGLDGLRRNDPSLVMLGRTVRRFVEHGVEMLVYVSPVNLEHAKRLGILDRRRLDRSLESIELTVTRNGGAFLDLHDLFPDAYFRDQPGHLVFRGDRNGPAELAAALAPAVRKLTRDARTGRR